MTQSIQRTKPRRRYSQSFKQTVVQACQAPNASIAEVARRHQLNANLVHKWIKKAKANNLSDPHPGFVALPVPPTTESAQGGNTFTLTLPTAQGPVIVEWPINQITQSAQWLKAVLS